MQGFIFDLQRFAEVFVGKATDDELSAVKNRTQVYGLAGNDTLKSTSKSEDVIWTDESGYFNLTLKGSNDASDYFDEEGHDYFWEILRLVNQERENENLSPLTLSEGLTYPASVRADEIVKLFEHTRPDGSSCFTAIEKDYWSNGENIAASQTSPEKVMTAWMNSEGHRANILSESFQKLGVGYTYDSSSNYRNYWVQMFGGGLMSPDTLSTEEILTTPITTQPTASLISGKNL